MKNKVLTQLLDIELQNNAFKLGFIEKGDFTVSSELLQEAISVLNQLSVKGDEESKKYLIAICALLWTYKDESWDGLKDYLTLFLSRAGFGPSSIMIDKEYNPVDSTFAQGSSIINMFSITLSHLEYEINISDKKYLISEFQKSIWDGIEKSKVIGISAPTSAGKSFLILLKAIELIILIRHLSDNHFISIRFTSEHPQHQIVENSFLHPVPIEPVSELVHVGLEQFGVVVHSSEPTFEPHDDTVHIGEVFPLLARRDLCQIAKIFD